MPPSRHSSSHHRSSSSHSSSHHRSTSSHSSSHHSSFSRSYSRSYSSNTYRRHSSGGGLLGALLSSLINSSGSGPVSTETQTQTIIPKNESLKYVCRYCDSTFLYDDLKDGEGEVTKDCPNCGARMEYVGTQSETPISSVYHGPSVQKTQSTSVSSPAKLVTAVVGIFAVVIIILVSSFSRASRGSISTIGSSKPAAVKQQKEIYVKEIGRDCVWSEADQSYYDEVTDCYFWYNDESLPAMWQYWYEGISSDYGDYGWMEYNTAKKCWYIEERDGQWVKLPEKYNSSRLWHIE